MTGGSAGHIANGCAIGYLTGRIIIGCMYTAGLHFLIISIVWTYIFSKYHKKDDVTSNEWTAMYEQHEKKSCKIEISKLISQYV